MRTYLGVLGPALICACLALACAACGNGKGGDFTNPTIAQRDLQTGAGATITLAAGDSLTIPAGTFDRETIVEFADVLNGADGSTKYYPTATQAAGDLLGAVVVNTPVDRQFATDLPLTFDIIEP